MKVIATKKIGFITVLLFAFLLVVVGCQPQQQQDKEGISDGELFGSDADTEMQLTGAATGARTGEYQRCVNNDPRQPVRNCREENNKVYFEFYDKTSKTWKPGTKEDRCKNSGTKYDYSCVSSTEIKRCEVSCAAGEICQNGQCTTPSCTPLTCSGSCDTIPDGCGGSLNCGSCPTGYSCTDNSCVPTCVPKTQCDSGFQCGTQSDGCGGTISCGSCSSGQICENNICTGGTASPGQCLRECQPGQCGFVSDNCGGYINCGWTCPTGTKCASSLNKCVTSNQCTPDNSCIGRCGTRPDGCGSRIQCSSCPEGQVCNLNNYCVSKESCVPRTSADCRPGECGRVSDGCGGIIQCSCPAGYKCEKGSYDLYRVTENEGQDYCVACSSDQPPQCTPGQCGNIPNGCGGYVFCGCPEGQACQDNACVPFSGGGECKRNCYTNECGPVPDGCGGYLRCPNCENGLQCINNLCQEYSTCNAITSCEPGQCGKIPNGCGAFFSCPIGQYYCPVGEVCTLENQCVPKEQCVPRTQCDPGECGQASDGCGGTINCGLCPSGYQCKPGYAETLHKNVCQYCAPEVCQPWQCGQTDDGCGGKLDCGSCDKGYTCGTNKICVKDNCAKKTQCLPNECGKMENGCGGFIYCGVCADGASCVNNQCLDNNDCQAGGICGTSLECGTQSDSCGGVINCDKGLCYSKVCLYNQCVAPVTVNQYNVPSSTCGNGIVDPGEECDDGSPSSDYPFDSCHNCILRSAPQAVEPHSYSLTLSNLPLAPNCVDYNRLRSVNDGENTLILWVNDKTKNQIFLTKVDAHGNRLFADKVVLESTVVSSQNSVSLGTAPTKTPQGFAFLATRSLPSTIDNALDETFLIEIDSNGNILKKVIINKGCTKDVGCEKIGHGYLLWTGSEYAAHYSLGRKFPSGSWHAGAALRFYSSEGVYLRDAFDWGCSHPISLRLAYNGVKLGADCLEESGIVWHHNAVPRTHELWKNPKPFTIRGGTGSIAPTANGFLVAVTHPQILGSDRSDVAIMNIDNNGNLGPKIWLTNTPYLDEWEAYITPFEGGYLVGWATYYPHDQYKFFTNHLIRLDVSGKPLGKPEMIEARLRHYGMDMDIYTYPNGDVGWATLNWRTLHTPDNAYWLGDPECIDTIKLVRVQASK